ncbi:zinc finger protein 260-like isoform X2 [Amphiprion ocellaris]|uniref:zinc finger protein 260-like isoform X2 n=1 Tax=Amphiprion ocellaris TaxID=80972 RepID=UPI002410DFB8|nr:zinc finger protein 260-like isoform X2 [Amphiprion ocellaris]
MDGGLTKAAALRRVVTDRLSAASRDILAALDRILAEYEAEASGFRREIDRQKRQLELLQPQVALSAAGVKRSRSFISAEEEEAEDEESSENLTGPSRSLPSRCQYDRKKPSRPQIREQQNHIDFRICVLDDSNTGVLSKNALKKCPILDLKCPRGLQEADFLDLLRSASAQLDKPFDILMSDQRRRLQPVRVKTLTAEEILSDVGCIGRKTPMLYVRLKSQDEVILPLQTPNSSLVTSTCEEPNQQTRPKNYRLFTTCSNSWYRTSPHGSRSPIQEVEGSTLSTVSHQRDVETEEAAEEEPTPAEGKAEDSDDDEKDEERGEESDDIWKPDKSDEKVKKTKLRSKKCKVKRCGAAAFCCRICGALHQSEVSLVKHAWTHEDDLVCGACGEHSESEDALKDHLQSSHKTEACHICGESFLSAFSLNEHVAAHSGEKPHECSICRRTFALKATLEHHEKLHQAGKQLKTNLRTHGNRKSHLCGVCGKSLSDYRSLSRHKMTHSGERPHSCQICGRCFKLPGTLRQHEKIHTNRERSYLCDVCCKMFLTAKQLQIHMRTHTNEKPYHCGECGRGFTTKGPLTVHMRVHTGEAPYRCPVCGWSFKRKTNLDNHVAIHSGVKPFVCGICGKACARKTYLTVHMRTHNGERPYKCTICEKAFTQSHCLKTHMKSHQAEENAT